MTRRKGLSARLRRSLRWALRVALVALVIDLIYVASIWPDWRQIARGPIPKSSFMHTYPEKQPDRQWPALQWQPVPLDSLPRHLLRAAILAEGPDADLAPAGVAGNSLELSLTLNPANATQCGLKVCSSPDGEEQSLVFYDAGEKKLKVDTSRSSRRAGPKTVEAGDSATFAAGQLRVVSTITTHK